MLRMKIVFTFAELMASGSWLEVCRLRGWEQAHPYLFQDTCSPDEEFVFTPYEIVAACLAHDVRAALVEAEEARS
jgi:hypothetical protein